MVSSSRINKRVVCFTILLIFCKMPTTDNSRWGAKHDKLLADHFQTFIDSGETQVPTDIPTIDEAFELLFPGRKKENFKQLYRRKAGSFNKQLADKAEAAAEAAEGMYLCVNICLDATL
jgi:hypothetical protein